MRTLLLPWLSLLCLPAVVHAQEFIDGTHLVNQEDAAIIIIYDHPTMTTAICDIKEPTAEIKSGLVGALDRQVEGFTVISRERGDHGISVKVTAKVEPNTRVNCLCVRGCDVEVVDVGTVEIVEGGTVLVKEGTVMLQQTD